MQGSTKQNIFGWLQIVKFFGYLQIFFLFTQSQIFWLFVNILPFEHSKMFWGIYK